jgi:hypothetical protein
VAGERHVGMALAFVALRAAVTVNIGGISRLIEVGYGGVVLDKTAQGCGAGA